MSIFFERASGALLAYAWIIVTELFLRPCVWQAFFWVKPSASSLWRVAGGSSIEVLYAARSICKDLRGNGSKGSGVIRKRRRRVLLRLKSSFQLFYLDLGSLYRRYSHRSPWDTDGRKKTQTTGSYRIIFPPQSLRSNLKMCFSVMLPLSWEAANRWAGWKHAFFQTIIIRKS